MIQQFFLPALQERDLDHVLQQDGATSHTSRVFIDVLRAALPRMTNLPAWGQESNPVDDDSDEDEDNNNNNESSKGPSNADAFSALETAMEWYQQQSKCCPTQILLLKRIKDLAAKKRRCTMSGCKLPHDVALSDKAPLWSPVVFLAKFAPIVGSGHQHSMADAVAFLSHPRHARLERNLVNWLARKVFDKL
ncbi:uncharacterized protein TNCV_1823111 [Trichonephila clavipes]|nr:uncharacterized protein TNCV_1823111 [Trichonephila clavipes]